MTQNKIVVAGGGFAGLWAALTAAAERERTDAEIGITLVSRDDFLTLRPRLYQPDPERFRIPLRPMLDAVGVTFAQGEIEAIDADGRKLGLGTGRDPLVYDRLVLATGSVMPVPPISGVTFCFDVDTMDGAIDLQKHLTGLEKTAGEEGADNVVVVGAGFTGIEIATGMRDRLVSHIGAARAARARIVLVDSADVVGSELGANPRPVIEAGLDRAGIDVERRLGTRVRAVDAAGVELETGERIPAGTVILATGLRASPLAGGLRAPSDELGRLVVDAALRIPDCPDIFATGDVARANVDEAGHVALMSCQHAMTMGRYAGHNAVCDLTGAPLETYRQERYVTCLDLGAAGAVFTQGWDRKVELTGEAAKAVKNKVNGELIYPPGGDRAAILAAATLVPEHHRTPPEEAVAS